jgi:hypothetical protein
VLCAVQQRVGTNLRCHKVRSGACRCYTRNPPHLCSNVCHRCVWICGVQRTLYHRATELPGRRHHRDGLSWSDGIGAHLW